MNTNKVNTLSSVKKEIHSIDFHLIEEILNEMRKKSSIQKGFHAPDIHIRTYTLSEAVQRILYKKIPPGGLHSVDTNTKEHTITLIVPPIGWRNNRNYIHGVIHECVHAAGINSTEDMDGILIFQSGYTQRFLKDLESVDWFGLNEGMTEIIADRILVEYNTRTGNPQKNNLQNSGYKQYISHIRELIDLLSGYGYGSDTKILEGFISGYFTGVSLEMCLTENMDFNEDRKRGILSKLSPLK